MKIYAKILLTTLPIGILFMVITGMITTHLCGRSLTDLASTWLDTRLSEAVEAARQQNDNLKKYGLENVRPSILQAKLDAAHVINTIEVGKDGFVFVVDDKGTIISNPDADKVGTLVTDQPWFQALRPQRGSLTFSTPQGPHLAIYDYFEPWQWYVIATDPHSEFFGAAGRITPLLWGVNIMGGLMMAIAVIVLARRLTLPLKNLTQGTRRVGRGDLSTMIQVTSNDELGTLADHFNQMTRQLQAITVLRDELESAVAKRTRELTEINRRLIRTERFAAAGQLATTVAHEINSPLQGIFSLVNLLKECRQDDPDTLEDLESIEMGLTSIKKTVRNLMDLNRPGGHEKAWINLNQIIEDTLCLFSARMAKQGGEIRFHLDDRLPSFFGSAQLISHVLVNLVNNAMEAVDEQYQKNHDHPNAASDPTLAGSISAPIITVETRQHEGHLHLVFSDNGPGISPEALDHLFDPFFTTKKQLGMGVGLSICLESIQAHGGTMEADNAPEGGARFSIMLPTGNAHSEDPEPPTNPADPSVHTS